MPKLQWYGSKANTHRKVVRQPGIKATNAAKAEEIEAMAEILLAPHHANNAAKRKPTDSISYIETSSGTVDAFVTLVDDDGGAAAIEARLGPLKKAAGMAAARG